ncbi:hypothetical protein AOLI_G00112030 [Acnodon oligacanthus]
MDRTGQAQGRDLMTSGEGHLGSILALRGRPSRPRRGELSSEPRGGLSFSYNIHLHQCHVLLILVRSLHLKHIIQEMAWTNDGDSTLHQRIRATPLLHLWAEKKLLDSPQPAHHTCQPSRHVQDEALIKTSATPVP